MRTLLASTLMTLALATAGAATERGSPEEAQAMLARVVVAINADKVAALAAINAHDPRFKEKDLYVFCGGEDGRFTAYSGVHGTPVVGQNMRAKVDLGGRPFGEMIYKAAVAGRMSTVEYAWFRPGEMTASKKVAFVTKIADQVCGVGYYR